MFQPFDDVENNALEVLVLWATSMVAATGILFFAPTLSFRGVPPTLIWAATVMDVALVGVTSVVIIVVMAVSAKVVLHEEYVLTIVFLFVPFVFPADVKKLIFLFCFSKRTNKRMNE